MQLSKHRWKRWGRQCGTAALDLLLPSRCLACDEDLPPGGPAGGICQGCQRQIHPLPAPVCPQCGGPVPRFRPANSVCVRCRLDPPAFDRTLALGSYDGLLRTLVLRMKTDASELLADALAQLWWESHGRSVAATGVDAVTCVPMHPWKRWRRGVNAPAAIAERVAQQLAVPGWLGFLKKRRNRLPQKGLSRAGRLRNIRGGVFASTRYPIQSAHVLLVDDVLTTGATCHESARIAKQAGAREVTVAVVARATTD